MSEPNKLNFSSAIRKVIEVTYPNVVFSNNVIKLVGKAMTALNEKLVSQCMVISASNYGDAPMDVNVAADVVNQMFSGNLKEHAMASATRYLLMHSTGCLQYEPPKTRTLKRIRSKEETTEIASGSEFSKGLKTLITSINPEASIRNAAKNILCMVLGSLAQKISEYSKSSAEQSKVITIFDLKAAVESVLLGQLKEHAIAEGSRMVSLLELGIISFKPTEKRSRKDVSRAKKQARKDDSATKKRTRRDVPSAKKKAKIVRKKPSARKSRKRVEKRGALKKKPAMQADVLMQTDHFTQGIRQTYERRDSSRPFMPISENAEIYLGNIASALNEKIVKECLRISESDRSNVMEVNVAMNAVNNIVFGDLKSHAIAEGNRATLLHSCGCLQYEPPTAQAIKRFQETLPEIKAGKALEAIFGRGITKLIKLFHPESSIQANAKRSLCHMLGKVAKNISDSAKSSVENSEIMTYMDIKLAVERILPERMRQHAMAEAAKMLEYLECGWIHFEPVKKRVSWEKGV